MGLDKGFHVEHGDIFERHTQAIVNPVNCVGVMGAGLAKEFKYRYPEMFYAYRLKCRKKEIEVGRVWYWLNSVPAIICFPTKYHWKNPSQISYIKLGLENLINTQPNFKSISIPALGCGLGGLKLLDVKKLMQEMFSDISYRVEMVIQ